MIKKVKLSKVCNAILEEAINRGVADFNDPTWNPKYEIEINLSIEELRMVADLIRFKPSQGQKQIAKKAKDWQNYITELDS